MQSVTSNAVYQGLGAKTDTQTYFNADTNKETIANRINAINNFIPRTLSGIYRIRYSGGFYYTYITAGTNSEETIMEISPYDGAITIFKRYGTTTTRVRTI